jgi:hypothetical protein
MLEHLKNSSRLHRCNSVLLLTVADCHMRGLSRTDEIENVSKSVPECVAVLGRILCETECPPPTFQKVHIHSKSKDISAGSCCYIRLSLFAMK